MKKKSLSSTYLRGVDDYQIKIKDDIENDCYIAVKKINNIDEPYIEGHTGKDICLLNKGYYLVEYLTKKDNYGVRVFMDENKNVKGYYIDVVESIGIENGYPYYMDLYIDITLEPDDIENLIVWDEDELIDAMKDNKVNAQQFEVAHEVKENLLTQIRNGKNKFINMDHVKTVEEILGC